MAGEELDLIGLAKETVGIQFLQAPDAAIYCGIIAVERNGAGEVIAFRDRRGRYWRLAWWHHAEADEEEEKEESLVEKLGQDKAAQS